MSEKLPVLDREIALPQRNRRITAPHSAKRKLGAAFPAERRFWPSYTTRAQEKLVPVQRFSEKQRRELREEGKIVFSLKSGNEVAFDPANLFVDDSMGANSIRLDAVVALNKRKVEMMYSGEITADLGSSDTWNEVNSWYKKNKGTDLFVNESFTITSDSPSEGSLRTVIGVNDAYRGTSTELQHLAYGNKSVGVAFFLIPSNGKIEYRRSNTLNKERSHTKPRHKRRRHR